MDSEELNNRFKYHPPAKQETALAHSAIRLECNKLANLISVAIPEGREKSLAMTKLEEVMFWANAAIARNQEVNGNGTTGS